MSLKHHSLISFNSARFFVSVIYLLILTQDPSWPQMRGCTISCTHHNLFMVSSQTGRVSHQISSQSTQVIPAPSPTPEGLDLLPKPIRFLFIIPNHKKTKSQRNKPALGWCSLKGSGKRENYAFKHLHSSELSRVLLVSLATLNLDTLALNKRLLILRILTAHPAGFCLFCFL